VQFAWAHNAPGMLHGVAPLNLLLATPAQVGKTFHIKLRKKATDDWPVVARYSDIIVAQQMLLKTNSFLFL